MKNENWIQWEYKLFPQQQGQIQNNREIDKRTNHKTEGMFVTPSHQNKKNYTEKKRKYRPS